VARRGGERIKTQAAEVAATRQETMASMGRVIAAAASNGVTSPLRLVYLAVRARAEVPRMILEYGKVEYVDVSVQQQFEAPWGKVKRQNMVPFGQLPVLDVGGGELIAQEAAIARYCATLVPGLMPSDPIGQAKCDALFHAAEELAETNPLVNALRGEDFERRKKEFFDKEFPRRLANFSRIIAASGGPFTRGKSPNYADFKLYHHLSNAALLEPGCLSPSPDAGDAMTDFMAAVENLDGIAAYLNRRPQVVDVGKRPKLEPNVCGSRYLEG